MIISVSSSQCALPCLHHGASLSFEIFGTKKISSSIEEGRSSLVLWHTYDKNFTWRTKSLTHNQTSLLQLLPIDSYSNKYFNNSTFLLFQNGANDYPRFPRRSINTLRYLYCMSTSSFIDTRWRKSDPTRSFALPNSSCALCCTLLTHNL